VLALCEPMLPLNPQANLCNMFQVIRRQERELEAQQRIILHLKDHLGLQNEAVEDVEHRARQRYSVLYSVLTD